MYTKRVNSMLIFKNHSLSNFLQRNDYSVCDRYCISSFLLPQQMTDVGQEDARSLMALLLELVRMYFITNYSHPVI